MAEHSPSSSCLQLIELELNCSDKSNKQQEVSINYEILDGNMENLDDTNNEADDREELKEDWIEMDDYSLQIQNNEVDGFNEQLSHSHEFEAIDVAKYLDSAINSKLEDVDFKRNSECRDCSEQQFETYQMLLSHTIVKHKNEKNHSFCCILEECQETFDNSKLLARHIVLKHCTENLHSLQIYVNCPDCDLRFSNFMQFNKHSCYRVTKRKSIKRNYCNGCQLEFVSFTRFVFHLQFHLSKRRPKVCLICESFFSDIDEFFQHVHYSHESTETRTCSSCDRRFNDINSLESHKRGHDLKAIYVCGYCPETYDQKCLLDSHLYNNHNDKPREFQCDICNKVFLNQSGYRKHMKGHEPEADVQVLICSNCGLVAGDACDLEPHIEDQNSDCYKSSIDEEILSAVYTCEFCSLDFRKPSDLKSHRATGIHNNKMYECWFCKVNFHDLKRMRNHTKTHKTYNAWLMSFPLVKMFMCNVQDCEDSYSQWSALHNHKKRCQQQQKCVECNQIHKGPCLKDNTEFKCQFCGKECPTKMSLSVHISRSHNNRNISCPTCKASYKNDKSLQDHVDYMHVPVPCPYCPKVIKNKRNLENHQRIVHINEHRYYCQVCRKGFYYRSEKEAHEKNVHPDIAYKCPECSFNTNYTKSLDVHMAIHKKDLPFKCHICSKGFARKLTLDTHIKRHEVQREFICSQRILNGCDASFISNYLLNKHIRSKHSNSVGSEQCQPLAKRQKMQSIQCIDLAYSEDADDPEVVGSNVDMETVSDDDVIEFIGDD